ncbi:MAG: leucine--tRNA ligase [Myxococcota bacterium]|nr:leucine--tRNA ligase [Myxococcota bacterium]
MSRYEPSEIEPRWQARWEQDQTFAAVEDPDKPKYYTLCMFPYPSGSGLHVGHPESYTAIDIIARYKRLRGFSVLNPIGWDSFGLSVERAAVREGRHPAEISREYIANFKRQLLRLGFSYDWGREISTSSVDYYRWTQWIFLKLHEQGLAYLAEVAVNWCPAQGTVLANEEVVDGKYVETGDPVERRLMKQWMLRITAYGQRLLDDLDGLDWPEGLLEMQRQWIGRSEGAEVTFQVEGTDEGFVVFTTRPDTLDGATYCVLAPEHPLVDAIVSDEQRADVAAYVDAARNRSDLDRQVAAGKEKTGVWTGACAINPVNGKPIPVWVADYVLMSYGTGAIMAVPAHDERDHEFAQKFGLEIIEVIDSGDGHDVQVEAYTGDGAAINSGPYDGLSVAEFKSAIIDKLEAEGSGERRVNFKLRDWLFSRQRYWGEPFPVVHLEDGSVQALDPADLPVELPHIDEFKPTEDGRPPLARASDWVETTFEGQPAMRETNTMPQWAGSCWYYLRYMDPQNDTLPFSEEAVSYWKDVDLYIGGVEHAVLHLLYARFWHKVLYDCGIVPTKEPFQRLFNQGMILAYSYKDLAGRYYSPSEVEQRGESWFVSGTDTLVETQVEKMSKSKKNTVDPMDVIEEYGADTLRIYEMFMGPLDQVKPWQTSGCDGILRFLSRVWRLFVNEESGETRDFGETSEEARKALHLAIKETTQGFEALRFNTPISRMMEFVNASKGSVPSQEDAEAFIVILSPYAPHIAEEIWSRFGHADLVAHAEWPQWDESALEASTVNIAVQVQGKLRGSLEVPRDMSSEEIVELARSNENVVRHLEGMVIVKEIVIPGRLVNFVVRPA